MLLVLLLLMIVAQLTFALGRHPTFCLHHLIRLAGSRTESLVGIITLQTRARLRAHAVKLADRVMARAVARATFYLLSVTKLLYRKRLTAPKSGYGRISGMESLRAPAKPK